MYLIDFTLINDKSGFSQDESDELYELQQEHVNGNCHGLTVLLSSFISGKVKVLVSADCGVIHSFIECGKDRYLDGWGLCNDTKDIIDNYCHSCTPGSISVRDASKKEIIDLCGIDCDDIEHAIEFWKTNEEYYDLPDKLKLPDDINKNNAIDTSASALKIECDDLELS